MIFQLIFKHIKMKRTGQKKQHILQNWRFYLLLVKWTLQLKNRINYNSICLEHIYFPYFPLFIQYTLYENLRYFRYGIQNLRFYLLLVKWTLQVKNSINYNSICLEHVIFSYFQLFIQYTLYENLQYFRYGIQNLPLSPGIFVSFLRK